MKHILCSFLLLVMLSACSESDPEPQEVDSSLQLIERDYDAMPEWGRSLQNGALAFEKSCMRIGKQSSDKPFGKLDEAGTYKDWQAPCAEFLDIPLNQEDPIVQNVRLQNFFETYFVPYEVRAGDEAEGLFTGYYESSLTGSRAQSDRYTIPLHSRPDDLVMVQLGAFRDDLKGRRIAGRVVGGTLKPYETRQEIVDGQWPHGDSVLVWLDNPVDAFFVQIQGSGRVQLDDGTEMRVGYAGQNGHPYYAIGRELITRGHIQKQDVSMQSIRLWLEQNPLEAAEVMNTNKSYVFFRELTSEGPIGGEGLALTPLGSLAIDRSLLPYGAPLWVDLQNPTTDMPALRSLLIAQDTGGAIRGAVRGDVFWGAGQLAEERAGKMKAKGRYWILLPKTARRKNAP